MIYCYACGCETDLICHWCDRPVCEDHLIWPTEKNHLEDTMCIECGDHREAAEIIKYELED